MVRHIFQAYTNREEPWPFGQDKYWRPRTPCFEISHHRSRKLFDTFWTWPNFTENGLDLNCAVPAQCTDNLYITTPVFGIIPYHNSSWEYRRTTPNMRLIGYKIRHLLSIKDSREDLLIFTPLFPCHSTMMRVWWHSSVVKERDVVL